MITLNQALAQYSPAKINSLSKYPSILTYHQLGEKGCLKADLSEEKRFLESESVYVTEKVDGTNSRILVWGDDYLIGSREQLLFARGDRFGDPALNIVSTVKGCAERMVNTVSASSQLLIFYGETYGGTVTAASKQYTSDKTCHFRLFDVAAVPGEQLEEVLAWDPEQISGWREHGGQCFSSVDELHAYGEQLSVDLVPYLSTIPGAELPLDLEGVYNWLQNYALTQAGINHQGQAEGVVLRTVDRSLIRKVRFEDYERTKKRGVF